MRGYILGLAIATSLVLGGIYLINKKETSNIKKKKVYFDMDGNMDDLVAFLLLINFENIEVVGITVTPADCYLDVGKEIVSKILYKKGLKIPVAGSDVEGVHPFPDSFKDLTVKGLVLPSLVTVPYNKDNEVSIDASEHMYNKVKEVFEQTNEKVSFLITGPPITFVKAMTKHPEIKDYIDEIVWMGGAIEVDGNVHDSPYSEYNAYFDPPSLKKFIESGLKIKVISLDSTNSVPISKDLLSRLAANKRYDFSNLVGEFFSIAYFIDPTGLDTYFAWDCLAALAISSDEFLTYKEVEVEVIDTKANSGENEEGRIKIAKGTNNYIEFAQKLSSEQLDKFYELFLNTLKKNF